MDIKRYIEVSFQKEGVHRYPAAQRDPKLKEVSYLSEPHRHLFYYYVRLEVSHNDRDVEFIMFKRELEQLYRENILMHDFKSCEMMAEDLIYYIREKYPKRDITVKVFEDDENGAVLEYNMDRAD